jgi:isoleucyl-tRNA synthetase
VKQVDANPTDAIPHAPLAFEVAKAEGVKCERCWNFSTHVGEDATFPTVCERCSANLAIIAGEQAGSTSA